jgi:hypothetical protein
MVLLFPLEKIVIAVEDEVDSVSPGEMVDIAIVRVPGQCGSLTELYISHRGQRPNVQRRRLHRCPLWP